MIKSIHGKKSERLIPQIKQAINTYPRLGTYRLWLGPNSNTFIAHLGLSVPELQLDLSSTAIGKDYRELANALGSAVSGTGWQLSLLGLAGITASTEEGIEINLLSLNIEWDVFDRAIELLIIGRIGASLE